LVRGYTTYFVATAEAHSSTQQQAENYSSTRRNDSVLCEKTLWPFGVKQAYAVRWGRRRPY